MNIDLVPIKSKNVKYFSIVNIGVTIVHLLFRFYTLNHASRFYIFSSHFSFYIFCGLNNVLFNFMICLDLPSTKGFFFCLYNSFKQILRNFFDNTFIANLLDNNISIIFISTKCFIFQKE